MPNNEIERMFRKYSRTTSVSGDEIVELEMVNEFGFKAALTEMRTVALREATEIAQKSSKCWTTMDRYKDGWEDAVREITHNLKKEENV